MESDVESDGMLCVIEYSVIISLIDIDILCVIKK